MSMKLPSVILLLLLFITGSVSAQHRYNNFVEEKNIRWAAEFSDTFHFSNPNLSEILRTQFLEGDIKVALVDDLENMESLRFESLPAVMRRMRPNEEIAPTALRDSLFSPGAFNQQTKDLLEIRDIIYLEKNRLKSQVYAVSPKYIVQTSWGMILGTSNLFTTAFNSKRNWSKRVKRKAERIGGSRRTILLNENAGKSLKILYDQNLLQAIWPQLNSKYFETSRIDSVKTALNVPRYDENGAPGTIARLVPGLTPESFYSVDIYQTWFYNKQKNVLFGNIEYLVLNIKSGGEDNNNQQVQPLLKVLVK